MRDGLVAADVFFAYYCQILVFKLMGFLVIVLPVGIGTVCPVQVPRPRLFFLSPWVGAYVPSLG
jgi:hypothetical protein